MDTFDWFPITVLIVFYIVFLGRAAQMKFRGINPFVLGLGKKGFEGMLEVAFIFGLAAWTAEIVSHSLHLEFHILPYVFYTQLLKGVWMKSIGAVLIAGGLIVFILSLVSFGNSWRVGIDNRKAGDLVTTGVFSMTRNPIFLFLDMYFIGSWLIYPNVFFGAFAVVVAMGNHWQILTEERFLEANYGEQYLEYRERVRRYL